MQNPSDTEIYSEAVKRWAAQWAEQWTNPIPRTIPKPLVQHLYALVLIRLLGHVLDVFRTWHSRTSIPIMEEPESVRLYRRAISFCPPHFVGRDVLLYELADVLDGRYRSQGNIYDLQECIRSLQESLRLLPTKHRLRIPTLNNLAGALGNRCKCLGEIADLEESIRLSVEVLTFHPVGHPGRSSFLANLAVSRSIRYAHLGELSDLEECIRLHREALASGSAGRPDRASYLDNFASVLVKRYERLGALSDLEEGIRLSREALNSQTVTVGHPYRSSFLNTLAVSLGIRYDHLGEFSDLEECIRSQLEALSLCPVGHPYRSLLLSNLAVSRSIRYAHLGELSDLEESLRMHREALASRSVGCPDRASALDNFATTLGKRYERVGELSDLEEGIRLSHEALTFHPMGHLGRAQSLNNLAIAFGNRYSRLGELSDLEECIRLHQEVLAFYPVGPPSRSLSLSNLASSLSIRYSRLGEVSDAEECIRLHQEALELCPIGHRDRPLSLNNLAAELRKRYERLHELPDLEEGIRLLTESLRLCPAGNSRRAVALNNLATALSNRYEHLGELRDMEKCISLYLEARELCPMGHPYHSSSLSNLAISLTIRHARLGKLSDLESCIRLHSKALASCPVGNPRRATTRHNLATALSRRYERLRKTEDLDQAIAFLRPEKEDISSPQVDILHGAFLWVELAGRISTSTLEEAFMSTVSCLRQYLSIGPTASLQYNALLRQSKIASLPTNAAAYFIEKGKVEQAVELLDESRALLMSEMRRFRETLSPSDQEKIGGDLATRYLCLCEELRNMSNAEVKFETFSGSSSQSHISSLSESSTVAYGELMKEKRVKMEEFDRLLADIRNLPGCDDFQSRPKFEDLQVAAKEGPIIIVNTSSRRSDIIIVFLHRSPLHIQLEEEFNHEMQRLHDYYVVKMSTVGESMDPPKAMSAILKHTAKELWQSVVGLVVKSLQDNGIQKGSRIWWCPTSFLTSLPFHAAGRGSRWLVDHYVSSYTPTLSALINARQSASMNALEQPIPRILVVAQTQTSGLVNAVTELRVIERLSSFRKCLDEEAATPQSVAEHLPSYDWVHFTCHGTVLDNPFNSFLSLHNNSRLSLNDIVKLHLKDAKFAFLAACHSAGQSRGKVVLRDEVLHLAAAMQVSGFRSVVGTMWEMEDEDGPLLAEALYKEMLEVDCESGERHTRAAGALWKATRWLKNDKKLPLARWANYIHIGA